AQILLLVIIESVLFSYLVTSRARRELLRLLWAEGVAASVSELARRARVSFAAAHRELEATRGEDLTVRERVGASLVYRANRKHPQAALLGRLLAGARDSEVAPERAQAERVRGWLAAVGAPLLVSQPTQGQAPRLEEVVAEGLAYSHRDAAAARALPLVFWL